MKVLVICEYSATVRDAFRKRGHFAMSCDLLATEGNPTFHYQGPIGRFFDIFGTDWDLMIAHPPCTYLTNSAAWAYAELPMINGKPRNMKPGTLIGEARRRAREEALAFVSWLWHLPIKRKCIENPVGCINSRLDFMPKPQYLQPYDFGEDASKNTGLWLDELPPLAVTKYFPPRVICKVCKTTHKYEKVFLQTCWKCLENGEEREQSDFVKRWSNQTDNGQNCLPPSVDRGHLRSAFFQGVADAMADQWGVLRC